VDKNVKTEEQFMNVLEAFGKELPLAIKYKQHILKVLQQHQDVNSLNSPFFLFLSFSTEHLSTGNDDWCDGE
jgi:hypothetical protein